MTSDLHPVYCNFNDLWCIFISHLLSISIKIALTKSFVDLVAVIVISHIHSLLISRFRFIYNSDKLSVINIYINVHNYIQY